MLFFDFTRELIELNRTWRSHLHFLTSSPEFYTCSLHGDKGCGKTSLIKTYLQKNPNAYYVSFSGGNKAVALENFRTACFPNAGSAQDWDDAFSKAAAAFKGKPVMIFLDDFADLGSDAELLNAFQKFSLSQRNVLLVTVGSHIKTEKTKDVSISPRSLADFCKVLPGYSKQDIARLYAVTGGVLPVMKKLDRDIRFEENLRRLLRHDSSFSQFVPALLRESFRTPASYYPILYSISQGKHRLSEIAADIGFPNNKCGKYLEALIDAGFVVAERSPMGKRSTYYLKNSYLSFWFKYLYRNHSLLVSDTERLLDIVFKDLDERIVLPAVHESCIRYMRRGQKGDNHRLFAQFDRAKNKPVSFRFRDGFRGQFDCVLSNDKDALLCVFPKDLDARFTKNDLEHYLKAANRHGTAGNTQLMIFSLHRFSDWCVHTASNVPLLFEITTERLRY